MVSVQPGVLDILRENMAIGKRFNNCALLGNKGIWYGAAKRIDLPVNIIFIVGYIPVKGGSDCLISLCWALFGKDIDYMLRYQSEMLTLDFEFLHFAVPTLKCEKLHLRELCMFCLIWYTCPSVDCMRMVRRIWPTTSMSMSRWHLKRVHCDTSVPVVCGQAMKAIIIECSVENVPIETVAIPFSVQYSAACHLGLSSRSSQNLQFVFEAFQFN